MNKKQRSNKLCNANGFVRGFFAGMLELEIARLADDPHCEDPVSVLCMHDADLTQKSFDLIFETAERIGVKFLAECEKRKIGTHFCADSLVGYHAALIKQDAEASPERQRCVGGLYYTDFTIEYAHALGAALYTEHCLLFSLRGKKLLAEEGC